MVGAPNDRKERVEKEVETLWDDVEQEVASGDEKIEEKIMKKVTKQITEMKKGAKKGSEEREGEDGREGRKKKKGEIIKKLRKP